MSHDAGTAMRVFEYDEECETLYRKVSLMCLLVQWIGRTERRQPAVPSVEVRGGLELLVSAWAGLQSSSGTGHFESTS